MWLSIYIYPTHSVRDFCEESFWHLLDSVRPDRRCFYVRYHDWIGPHLRLRCEYNGLTDLETLKKELAALFRPPPTNLKPSRTLVQSTFPGLRGFRIVRYRPEVRRYCGANGILVAEMLFTASTRWIRNNRKEILSSPAKSMILSGMTAVCLLELFWQYTRQKRPSPRQVFTPFIAKIANGQGSEMRSVLAQLKTLWATDSCVWLDWLSFAASSKATAFHLLRSYDTLVGNAFSKSDFSWNTLAEEKIVRFVSSIVHMNNNRLGLSNRDEAVVAYAVLKHYACII